MSLYSEIGLEDWKPDVIASPSMIFTLLHDFFSTTSTNRTQITSGGQALYRSARYRSKSPFSSSDDVHLSEPHNSFGHVPMNGAKFDRLRSITRATVPEMILPARGLDRHRRLCYGPARTCSVCQINDYLLLPILVPTHFWGVATAERPPHRFPDFLLAVRILIL